MEKSSWMSDAGYASALRAVGSTAQVRRRRSPINLLSIKACVAVPFGALSLALAFASVAGIGFLTQGVAHRAWSHAFGGSPFPTELTVQALQAFDQTAWLAWFRLGVIGVLMLAAACVAVCIALGLGICALMLLSVIGMPWIKWISAVRQSRELSPAVSAPLTSRGAAR